ncbi:GNAT family N-acetyltransferase [Sulfidibacter corallicola]|uniref:GNAT family N-acetyltransferase n=1 Tax=Sulfidibacter corallicola TaxID=2818388 RepID=A0A8A4TXN5_SULCO|nr:GNAT family N-acetyltransferase [Sulfidibacter corallicola]QTD54097.1 GNAT family N-acetyltransferase [Sulfidibacter corallicola]
MKIEKLGKVHDREAFNCGSEPLDRYFKTQVTQDVRRRVTACFVAISSGDHVAGYFTLNASSVLIEDLPEAVKKKLPRYPTVPVVRMGRLAVDVAFKGQGLGAALLAEALNRSASSGIGAFALVVDAKDAHAASFYRHFGFQPFQYESLTLFLPLATALKVKP